MTHNNYTITVTQMPDELFASKAVSNTTGEVIYSTDRYEDEQDAINDVKNQIDMAK